MTGSIVYATEQGLGYLAKDFYDNGVIDLVLVHKHKSRPTHYDWYPNRAASVEELLDKCDTLLFFETPMYTDIIKKAKERGIKTIIMPMYECTLPKLVDDSDVVINPSLLDQKYYPQGQFIPVPVTQKWRQREKARVFVHNAGHGGLGGRNGTDEVLKAMKYVKSPIKLIIRAQSRNIKCADSRVEIYGSVDRDSLYEEGDVFLFPEKFNGLSLPLQEAYASGMLVMAGDRFPMNTWLPKGPLIPVKGYEKQAIAVSFDMAMYDPKDIAAKIDEWYDQDITQYSLMGKQWAEEHSWEKLKSRYLNVCGK